MSIINQNESVSSESTESLMAFRLNKIDAEELNNIQIDPSVGIPYSNDYEATFTDFYQITMMYAYWKSGVHMNDAVFEVSFRKCPFNGEFAVFAGTSEMIRFINTLRFKEDQLNYLRQYLPSAEDGFFEYLRTLNGSELRIFSIKEGTVVFPYTPVVRVEGPLGVAQLVETSVLNLLNFPTLITTNAARHRLVAGENKRLLEFGARRAQGPDGAMSASRYSYLGGFDATSNVRAGYLFNIPISGTHAHSLVTVYTGLDKFTSRGLYCTDPKIECEDFVSLVLKHKAKVNTLWSKLNMSLCQHEGELAAFCVYAQSFPNNFLVLVDTFDTLISGIPNFLSVALALNEIGGFPVGIRLDSGDLAYLSQEIRKIFRLISEAFDVDFGKLLIVASNHINEEVIVALNSQSHEIDAFGIGTHLVTCQLQPSLGMVYKLVELSGRPCMKLSQELLKTSIPAKKSLYRLYTKSGFPVVDLVQSENENPPKEGDKIFCYHVFDAQKRCFVIPHKSELLHVLFWDKGTCCFKEKLEVSRERCKQQLKLFRKDLLRVINPTPYKVSLSAEFHKFFYKLWENTTPIMTLE